MKMKSLKIGDLKIRVPIIQGGMGIGISLSKLASAVANMGGVGIISTVGIGQTGIQSKLEERKYRRSSTGDTQSTPIDKGRAGCEYHGGADRFFGYGEDLH